MEDSRKKISRIMTVTAGVWLISLLVFVCGLFLMQPEQSTVFWMAAGYGSWVLMVFGVSYILVRRTVNQVMSGIDDCLQSMIDGKAVQHFSVAEESLQGKFQAQILKLYAVLNGAKEREEKLRMDMSDMVADLVHQVQTPLTNIQMYTGFLMNDDLPEKEREQICDVIEAQVEKLGWFADGFSKTARLDEDMMQMTPKEQPILDMVLGAIDQITLKAMQHGNEVILKGYQSITAVFDRRWTEEALFNLLDNAVKYGDEGTPVIVEMQAYDLFVRIDVKNTGRVIPKEEYNQLFARFYRGSNAALVKEGVGLGLYLTRRILTEQGGFVKVSLYGRKGNIFSIFLRKEGRPDNAAV